MKRQDLIIVGLWLSVILLHTMALQQVGAAQEKPSDAHKDEGTKGQTTGKEELVQKIVDVKFVSANQVASVLQPFVSGPLNRAWPNNELRVVTLVGTAENVAKMEEAIKRLDVPPPPVQNIELLAYLLVTSGQETPKKLSPELDGVVTQLKSVFPYSGFRLLDTLMVRCRDGKGGEASGVAPSVSGSPNVTLYQLNFHSANVVVTPAGRMVRLDGLKLGLRIPVKTGGDFSSFSYIDTGTNADIDVREGQKVIVGKSTTSGSDNPLFLVLSAKVVD